MGQRDSEAFRNAHLDGGAGGKEGTHCPLLVPSQAGILLSLRKWQRTNQFYQKNEPTLPLMCWSVFSKTPGC